MNAPTFTLSDEQSLVRKLAEFDAALTPAEREIFRARIAATMPDVDEVEGHRMEMQWGSGSDGIFYTWVHIEDSVGPQSRETSLDPNRWNRLSATTAEPSPVRGKRVEGTA